MWKLIFYIITLHQCFDSVCQADEVAPLRTFILPQHTGSQPSISLCFTPGEHCDIELVRDIGQAQFSIEVQAYHLTSISIIKALAEAQNRNILVRIIIDGKTPITPALMNTSLLIWRERMPGIAHNKVMIIDDRIVYTGSYNFTQAAEKRNAENLLRIEKPEIAQAYLENWHKHFLKSTYYEREFEGKQNNKQLIKH